MVLWKHECSRVFSDRFTIQDDKDWFNEELLRTVEEHLGPNLRLKTEPNPVFVDFMRYKLFVIINGKTLLKIKFTFRLSNFCLILLCILTSIWNNKLHKNKMYL